MANIVWIVIYAFSRSFWAEIRLDLAVEKFSSIEASLGWKLPRVFVHHNPYNITHDLYMISIVFGQKPKMAH